MAFSPPRGIITYQNLAKTKAIKNVMPNTYHRYCLWHILDTLPSNVGGVLIHNEGLIDEIKRCVHNSDTSSQFESSWFEIMTEYKLMDNDWLADIYRIRNMWVPAYLKHIFFAGISTTQRSESMNAFVKQYVEYKKLLLDFILRFDAGVKRLRYLEKKEDFENSNRRPKLKTYSPMEKQMADIYTRNIFYKFQYVIHHHKLGEKLVNEDDVECIFVVKIFSDEKGFDRQVVWKKEEMHAYYSYKKFEFEGIPCRHVMCIMRHNSIFYLPEHFILKRWTKGVTKEIFVDRVDDIGTARVNSCLARHSQLSCMFVGLINIASQSREGFDVAANCHTDFEIKLRKMMLNSSTTETSVHNGKGLVASNVIEYHEPAHVVTKGRAERLKSSKEKAQR